MARISQIPYLEHCVWIRRGRITAGDGKPRPLLGDKASTGFVRSTVRVVTSSALHPWSKQVQPGPPAPPYLGNGNRILAARQGRICRRAVSRLRTGLGADMNTAEGIRRLSRVIAGLGWCWAALMALIAVGSGFGGGDKGIALFAAVIGVLGWGLAKAVAWVILGFASPK